MPTFRYTALGQNGSGPAMLDAADRASAIRELVRRGVTPTRLEIASAAEADPLAPTPAMKAAGIAGVLATDLVTRTTVASTAADLSLDAARLASASWRSSMSRAEVAAFVRELSTAVQAGLPLVQALRTIARQAHGERQAAMLAGVIDAVEHGKSLAEALASGGRTFDELTVNMVRAGEASGRLGEVLHQAADLLDRDLKLRRSVLAATLYPMILAVLISISVVIVVTFIVPKILQPLAGKLTQLPLPTRIVQGVAGFVSGYWWLILPAIFVGGLAITRLYRTPGPRLKFDTTVLRVPVLGRLLRDVAVARFTRTLGTLVTAGMPAVAALRVTKGTLGNKAMERVVEDVCEQVTAGKTIADPMERSRLFPPMLVQIINLGERSGRLDQMLNQAADAFDNKTETSLKLFTTALPPILVVVLACAVGFVVLSILLPLLSAQEALG